MPHLVQNKFFSSTSSLGATLRHLFEKTNEFAPVHPVSILRGSPGEFDRGRKVGDNLGFSTHDDFLFGGLRFENGIDCYCPAGTKCDVSHPVLEAFARDC